MSQSPKQVLKSLKNQEAEAQGGGKHPKPGVQITCRAKGALTSLF